MSAVVYKNCSCRMSLYNFQAACCVAKPSCPMSDLRNGHVAMSNLVVQTHLIGREANGGTCIYCMLQGVRSPCVF